MTRIFLLLATAWVATAAAVGNPPLISRFTATPSRMSSGQSSTLAWTVTGATSLKIDPGVGAVTGTSVEVSPAATTKYTLTATNATGSRTATATVTLGNPPVINSFGAVPAQIPSGRSTRLTWSVSGGITLKIDPGVGSVWGSSVTVTPKSNTTYTLTATNGFGSRTATATVTLGNTPTITSFTVAPAQISSGQSTTLRWAATGADSLNIAPGIGAVTGSSLTITPAVSTTYTLTAANTFGSRSARVTVAVVKPPVITSLIAYPARVIVGQPSTLSWIVSGATAVRIDPSPGPVAAASVRVMPPATTAYTLTASNPYGTTTATVTVIVGVPPAITSFTATPARLAPGQSSTLSWTVTGSPALVISPDVGAVTGASVTVSPAATTTYALTAMNPFGTATASTTVAAGSLPVIHSFWTNPKQAAGPGVRATLNWSVTGATSLGIDHGVGPVTGTSIGVSPAATTTYTLTAANAMGSVTASTTVEYAPLVKLTSQLFYSEHALFIIPAPSQVAWTGSNTWGSVYSATNLDSYAATLKSVFPDDYFLVVVLANNLTPNSVPNVITRRRLADGIGMGAVQGVGVPNICRYNIGGGTVSESALGVLDHEMGHNWAVFTGAEAGSGHWLENSTAGGQMAAVHSDDGYVTVKPISGDPLSGFTWAAVDNLARNETETFSLHDLYLMGLNATFPDLYVLAAPVYNADHTVSYSSVARYDQAWVEQHNGVRFPTYRTSEKRFRMAFVYIARDVAEVLAVYQPIDRSIRQFTNAEQVDTTDYRFQVPFLVETHYRASVDARLADLDGNRTPTLTLNGPAALDSADGSARVPFSAADPDGPAPVVSCVPVSPNCSVSGSNVLLTGLATGTHFFTIKAEDTGGKKAFAHFVVDVM